MINIEGNKDALYQWEKNRRIILTNIKAGVLVDFSHEKFPIEECPCVESYKENGKVYANVPNILLQKNGIIKVYIRVQENETEYVEYHAEIIVLYKPKPADYIYTETEVFNLKQVDRKATLALELSKGSNRCKTYENYEEMINDINSTEADKLVAGQDIRVLTVNVPDVWIAYVDTDYVEYTYTTDDAIVEALSTDGFIKIGYYRLGALETQKVDLLDYVKNTDYATASKAGIVKATAANGVFCSTSGMLNLVKATDVEIAGKINNYKPIVPSNLDYAVKSGITTNAIELTEDEKAAVRNWIGAIKKPEKDVGGYYRVPITDAHGADGFLRAYNAPLQFAVVLYNTGGIVKTNAPKVDNDCANKKYVDDIVGDIDSALDELHTYAQSLIGGNA